MSWYRVVVRAARGAGGADGARLLRAGVMSHARAAGLTFLFQEITFQFTILLAAVMFIFIGLPIHMCVLTLPIVAGCVYGITYLTHSYKAAEISQLKAKKQWVAEAYEPYFLTTDTRTLKYTILDEDEASRQAADWDRMNKKIVGTVSLRDFHGPNNSMWLYGIAVDPGYQRKGIGRALAKAALDYCEQNNYDSLELVTSELQSEARLLFQNLGFEMRQMYHKRLLGSALTLAMFQQGIDFTPPRYKDT